MSDWKQDLGDFFEKKEKEALSEEEEKKQKEQQQQAVRNFFAGVVVPAFEEVDVELQNYGRDAIIRSASEAASIKVTYQNEEEINYTIKVKDLYPYVVLRLTDEKDGRRYVSEEYLRTGDQDYIVSDLSKEEIIHHFLKRYKQRLK